MSTAAKIGLALVIVAMGVAAFLAGFHFAEWVAPT